MTSSSRTLTRIVDVIVAKLGANLTEEDLRGALRLDEVIAFDSMALLEFVVGLENEFGIRFEQDRMKSEFILDVNALVRYLEDRSQ